MIVVEDSLGVPIPLATVSFRLPDSPLTGLFANGLRTEIATTASDGRASSSAVHWPSTPVAVRVTAAKGDLRAGIVVNVEGLNSASARPSAPNTSDPRTLAPSTLATGGRVSLTSAAVQPVPSQAQAPHGASQSAAQSATQSTAQPAGEIAAPPAGQDSANPIVLGASIAPRPPSPVPSDLVVPKYEPPSFWRSKWFLVGVAAGGALAAGFFAARPRAPGAPGAPAIATPITPGGGGAISLPVTIGPPTVIIGKP